MTSMIVPTAKGILMRVQARSAKISVLAPALSLQFTIQKIWRTQMKKAREKRRRKQSEKGRVQVNIF